MNPEDQLILDTADMYAELMKKIQYKNINSLKERVIELKFESVRKQEYENASKIREFEKFLNHVENLLPIWKK